MRGEGYTRCMGKNGESPQAPGLLASLRRLVTRVLDGEPAAEPEQPPLPAEPGPSGIPPGPLRIEKRS